MREAPTLETRMDDLRAVLDAVGSESAVLFGTFEAASMCLLFAATYPERTHGLVLYNPVAKGTAAPDYPWAESLEAWRRTGLDELLASWGTVGAASEWVRDLAPSFVDDPEFIRTVARNQRLGASPGAALTIRQMAADVDIRDILPVIRVPTLVLNMPASRGEAEYITDRIPPARRIEAPGPDYAVFLLGDRVYDNVEQFVRSLREEGEPDTVLATVLFTDIVGSTSKAAELGDRAWADLVRRHHALVRSQLDRFRGRELDTAGDGFFATFDGPIRAIRCATTIGTSVSRSRPRRTRRPAHRRVRKGRRKTRRYSRQHRRTHHRPSATRRGPRDEHGQRPRRRLGHRLSRPRPHALKGIPGEWRLFAVAEATTSPA